MRINIPGKLTYARIIGDGCLLAGLGCNQYVLEALFAGDGAISALPVKIGILAVQGFFILVGILHLRRAYRRLTTVGLTFLLLFVGQFWLRIAIARFSPPTPIFQALPAAPPLFEAGSAYRDQISRYESRLQPLIALLPPQSTIGYLTSPDMPFETAKLRYGLAKYALCPVLVDWSDDHDLIVGDFLNAADVTAALTRHPVIVLKDFGNGVVLLQRETAP